MINENLTELPKEWCIKQNASQIVCDWWSKKYNKTACLNCSYIYLTSDGDYSNILYRQEISFEQFNKWVLSKSLIGRYLKALVDYPNVGMVKKGEYGKIIDDKYADFPSQKGYSCETAISMLSDSNTIYDGRYELMPEGFNPNIECSIETPIEYVECIKGNNYNGYNILGKIYKVESYDKVSKNLKIEGYTETIHSIDFNNPYQFNQTDYCISTKEKYDIQNQPKFEVGKWYKYNNCYIKFKQLNGNIFVASDDVLRGKYDGQGGNYGDVYLKTYTLLTDLTEIQPYLPDGHVDKFPKEINYKELQDKAWEIYKDVKKGDKYIDTKGETQIAFKNAYKSNSIDENAFIRCDYSYLWEVVNGKELFATLLSTKENEWIPKINDWVKLTNPIFCHFDSKYYKFRETFDMKDVNIIIQILDIEQLKDEPAYKVKTPKGYTALRRLAFCKVDTHETYNSDLITNEYSAFPSDFFQLKQKKSLIGEEAAQNKESTIKINIEEETKIQINFKKSIKI